MKRLIITAIVGLGVSGLGFGLSFVDVLNERPIYQENDRFQAFERVNNNRTATDKENQRAFVEIGRASCRERV